MDTITLRDLIKHVRSGDPFTMKYVTLDVNRKKGGEIKEVSEAIGMKAPDDEAVQRALKREPTPAERDNIEHIRSRTRQPHHRRNFTMNYQVLQEGKPTSIVRKFHPALCIEFCGKIVTP